MRYRPLLLMTLFGGGLLGLTTLAFRSPALLPHPAAPEPVLTAADYPQGYFLNPVDDAIRLTGTFGELRPNHFHSGIDIKSKTGGVGQPVFAAADGFVDQIKVQASGYGNVVYLKHPNGYTTVYAHLDRFSPELTQYVRAAQYKNEHFEVALQPTDGQFPVKKGQEIGKLGNSGGSSGPHLHFEIRQSTTGKALNPLLFGLPVLDNIAPELRDMKVYFLNEKREVLTSRPLPLVRQKDGSYRVKGDTVRFGAWRIGLGVKSYDQQNLLRNDNGVYAISLRANDQPAYDWRIESLDFDETRYMNAHIDYAARQSYGAWFHRCFVLPGNKLSGYAPTGTLGAIALSREQPVKLHLKVSDAAGNTSSVTFWALRSEPMESLAEAAFQYALPFQESSRIETGDFYFNLPAGALYEDLRLRYHTTQEQSSGFFSSVHHLHHDATPLHRYAEIGLAPYGVPADRQDKAIVARCGDGHPVNCGGTWKNDRVVTRIRDFGDYCVMLDETPPTIVPVVFDADMRSKSSMSFRITDNFPTDAQADGLRYRGTVDGQWILFEYDRKRDRLTHTFDGRIGTGEHQLRLTVRDDRGNTAVLERTFLR
jgi:Peptidase family M23